MNLRRPKIEDLQRIRELHGPFENEFAIPDFSLLTSCYVVVEKEEIIAFGAIQPIFEAIAVLDQQKDKTTRLEALRLLLEIAEREVASRGSNQLHVFTQVKRFTNLMKKRFGYKNTKGSALVKVL